MTIINLQNANFYKPRQGLCPWNLLGGGGLQHPPIPQLFLPHFAPFAWASLLCSEGLPRFLLISVLMPVQRSILSVHLSYVLKRESILFLINHSQIANIWVNQKSSSLWSRSTSSTWKNWLILHGIYFSWYLLFCCSRHHIHRNSLAHKKY